jgi:hypothetical protein
MIDTLGIYLLLLERLMVELLGRETGTRTKKVLPLPGLLST